LGDQNRIDPRTTLHDRRRDTLAPSTWSFLGQVDEWAGSTPDLLHAFVQGCQGSLGEAGPDLPAKRNPSGP
jgi:hypothetical protein